MSDDRIPIGGACTWWKAAKSTSIAEAERQLDRLGLSQFTPKARTDQSCLRAAMEAVYSPADPKVEKYVFRPVKNGRTGFAVVSESPKEEKHAGDDWGRVVATAGFTEDGKLEVDPFDYDLFERIKEEMAGAKQWATASAVTASLVALVTGPCDGTTLREAGGNYWVPKHRLELWKEVREAFRQASAEKDREGKQVAPTEVFILHALADDEMVIAVSDALTSEVQAELAAIEADVAAGNLKETACLNRLRRTSDLEGKVKLYEGLFESPLTQLREAVQRASVAVAQATIQASASAVA